MKLLTESQWEEVFDFTENCSYPMKYFVKVDYKNQEVKGIYKFSDRKKVQK